MHGISLNPNETILNSSSSNDSIFLSHKNLQATFLLYNNIENASSLRKSLLNGEIEAALIKPSMILDVFQLEVACQKAVRNQRNERMTTRSVFAEIIYNLSPSKKISEAFKVFGFAEKDVEALIVVLAEPDSDKVIKLKSQIQGNYMDIAKLQELSNEKLIMKAYQIGYKEASNGSLLNSILVRMACKEFPIVK